MFHKLVFLSLTKAFSYPLHLQINVTWKNSIKIRIFVQWIILLFLHANTARLLLIRL